MKKATALALALILALSLCACGSSSTKEDPSLLGTYKLYAMDYDENTTLLAGELFEGESYITLKSGGAAEFCMEDDVANVKWKADGTNITVTAADGDMTGSLKNGVLTLVLDGSNLYFVADGASTAGIKAITLNEMLGGALSDITGGDEPSTPDTPSTPSAPSAPAAPAEPTEAQTAWNGWYFGCIDLDGCTGGWEALNGQTFDATMYIELGADGSGRFLIYDPFGAVVQNSQNNLCVNAFCHADGLYLYADSGDAFGCTVGAGDFIMVHNLADPEKVNTDFEGSNASGEKIDSDFQFRPWGDRWDGDDYAKFIPQFASYLGAVDAGLLCPFGDTFPGLGIANYAIPGVNGAGAASGGGNNEKPAEQPSSGGTSGGNSALLGKNPAKLDINGRGVVFVYYPGDQFKYNADYGKLKNEATDVGILIDPMLGSKNFEELKASYEKNNSDEQDYSLVQTTVNGYKAQILKYTDWLGSTMRVDIDFGGKHGDFYGISFAVSGDSLDDCDTPLVWAIIESMELAK